MNNTETILIIVICLLIGLIFLLLWESWKQDKLIEGYKKLYDDCKSGFDEILE